MTENLLNVSVELPLSKLRQNSGQIDGLPKNPRIQRGEQLERLKKSIEERPEMLGLRELLAYPYGEEFVVIGGDMRLKALKELGRRCRMVELDPHYCDVIINRGETITGKEARKL